MDRIRARRIASELVGQSVGGWTVGDYINNGASAVVLSASKADNPGALKLIDPELVDKYGEEKQLARIERERKLIGHRNPHLVKILDGGKCSATGYLFVVMELLVRPNLTTLIPAFPRER